MRALSLLFLVVSSMLAGCAGQPAGTASYSQLHRLFLADSIAEAPVTLMERLRGPSKERIAASHPCARKKRAEELLEIAQTYNRSDYDPKGPPLREIGFHVFDNLSVALGDWGCDLGQKPLDYLDATLVKSEVFGHNVNALISLVVVQAANRILTDANNLDKPPLEK